MHFSSIIGTVLWGLVLAKAKQGYNAANAKDMDSLNSAVRKTGIIVALVCTAAVIQYANADFLNNVAKNIKLQAPKETVQSVPKLPTDPSTNTDYYTSKLPGAGNRRLEVEFEGIEGFKETAEEFKANTKSTFDNIKNEVDIMIQNGGS